jgi:large subunit ribosomal protein L34e
MPLPKNRSSSVRKVYVRTPKSGTKARYKRRAKGGAHSCAITGARLQAVSSKPGMAASERRPNRKFGGTLSSAVSSLVIKIAARVKDGRTKLNEVDVRLLPYVKGLLSSKK